MADNEQVFEIKEYDMKRVPEYRRGIVEILICAAMNENSEVEDFDRIAVDILDMTTAATIETHSLQDCHD